jgi:hypothetical protein
MAPDIPAGFPAGVWSAVEKRTLSLGMDNVANGLWPKEC